MPPPDFRPFRWPQADWEDIGDATLDPGLEFVASWSARIMEERSSPPPLILLSPITAEDSQDSIMVQIGSPASELYTPAGLSVNRRRPRRPMKSSTKCEKPVPAKNFLFRDILCDPAMITNWQGATMAPGPGGTIHERTITGLTSSPGQRLCFPTYDLQCGGPRSSRGRAWCPVKPSPLPGVDWCSGIGLASGNESRPMV